MEVIIQNEALDASKLAARIVAGVIRARPDAVLGLATGTTPLGLYRELIRMHKEDKLDFGRVTTFNLDEYVGLSHQHPQSYHYYMRTQLFDHINISENNIHIPNGLAPDIAAHCEEYENSIKAAGGIDLQILGVGSDGHIGFNEPTSSLASRTRIKTLTRLTRADNARFFGNDKDVPHHVITMGIGTIMESRRCIMLAYGANKAEAVARLVEGPITAMCPASILQMHPDAKVFMDKAAAAYLRHTDYYQWVFDRKPGWQQF